MTPTALVLGGGGVTGIAWELGILKGLADAGLDLSTADLVSAPLLARSSGRRSPAGTRSTTCTPASSRHRTLRSARALPVDDDPDAAGVADPREPAEEAGQGRQAGDAGTPTGGVGADRGDQVAYRRRAVAGPRLRVTAVEAENGEFTVFDKDSEVDIVHAVAASCAVPLVWPAVTIDGRHYVDGGMRSTCNADLARARRRGRDRAPSAGVQQGPSIRSQLAATGAARTAVVTPDAEALAAIGKNVLDPSKRADAARTGLRQAAEVVEKVRRAWTA